MDDDDEIHYPDGFSLKDILAWGSFGLVLLDLSSETTTVVKCALDEQTQPFIDVEKRVYERFRECGGHPGILTYFGADNESFIRLQYASKHDLRSHLRRNAGIISSGQRQRWALQIAQSLRFIHQVGVVHGDLTCANVFLDEELNAKVADFSGSSLDKSPLLVYVTASHAHPTYAGSVKGDLFALGSVLYEITTGEAPYKALSEKEIEERYLRNDFPSTDSLALFTEVIRRCWDGKYDDSGMVIKDLQSTLTGYCDPSRLH